jgi:hypothetical protein
MKNLKVFMKKLLKSPKKPFLFLMVWMNFMATESIVQTNPE